jgi:hypothetical protein
VNNSGFEYRGDSVWGAAWKAAKEKAADLHEGIFRTVVKGDDERNAYFAKSKMFVNTKSYKVDDLFIF